MKSPKFGKTQSRFQSQEDEISNKIENIPNGKKNHNKKLESDMNSKIPKLYKKSFEKHNQNGFCLFVIDLPVSEEHAKAETCKAEEKNRVSRNYISWSKIIISSVLKRHFFYLASSTQIRISWSTENSKICLVWSQRFKFFLWVYLWFSSV